MNPDEEVSRLKAQLERWNAEAEAWEARVRSLRGELLARPELSAAGLQQMARGYEAAWRELRAAFDRACARAELPEKAKQHDREELDRRERQRRRRARSRA